MCSCCRHETESRLLAYAERFLAFLERPQAAALSLAGMTYTLQNGREEMDERLAILFTDLAQLREKLQRFCAGQQAISDLYHGNAQQSAAEYDLLTAGPAGRTFIAESDRGKRLRTACLAVGQGRSHRMVGVVRPPTTRKGAIADLSLCPGALLGTAYQGGRGHSSPRAR